MSNPAIQLFCANAHPMDRGADWCGACGEAPAKTVLDRAQINAAQQIDLRPSVSSAKSCIEEHP
jgi:hypothetical protein